MVPGNRLDGKIALITGGVSGIGQATAVYRFAMEGAKVVVVDLDSDGGQETLSFRGVS